MIRVKLSVRRSHNNEMAALGSYNVAPPVQPIHEWPTCVGGKVMRPPPAPPLALESPVLVRETPPPGAAATVATTGLLEFVSVLLLGCTTSPVVCIPLASSSSSNALIDCDTLPLFDAAAAALAASLTFLKFAWSFLTRMSIAGPNADNTCTTATSNALSMLSRCKSGLPLPGDTERVEGLLLPPPPVGEA